MEVVEYPYGSLAGQVELIGEPSKAQEELLNKMSPVFVNQNKWGETTVLKYEVKYFGTAPIKGRENPLFEEFVALADSIKGGNYR